MREAVGLARYGRRLPNRGRAAAQRGMHPPGTIANMPGQFQRRMVDQG